MKRHSVTIAIPAYNEAQSLPHIFANLLAQQAPELKIQNIFVYSDGSSDETAAVVRQFHKKHALIKLIDGRSRKGKNFRVGQIFRSCRTEFLVVLDADVGLVGDSFISSLVAPLISHPQKVMSVAHQEPLRSDSISGRILYSIFKLWDYIRLEIPNYDHVHNFYGAATAYRSSFARRLPATPPLLDTRDHIYSHAKAVDGFYYCRNTQIVYWPPTTFADYLKISRRSFARSKHSPLPLSYKIKGLSKAFMHDPLYTPIGLIISFAFGKLAPYVKPNKTPYWDIVKSSKKSLLPRLVISSYDDLGNPYYSGGGAVAVHEVASRLSSQFNIVVLTANFPGAKDYVEEQVSYRHVGFSRLGPKFGQLAFQMYMLYYARLLNYSLWVESFTPPFSVSLLPLVAKKPVVGLAHMLSAADMQRKYHLPFPVIERLGLQLYRHVISPSAYYSRLIKKLSPRSNVITIPNGVNPLPLSNGKVIKRKYISFLGRIEVNQKGLDLLLRAYKDFSRHSPYHLQIAGSGDAAEVIKLRQLIAQLRLDSRVHLLGRIGEREKIDFFKSSLVLAAPSRYETFSLSALEGLSSGVPYICFNIPGLHWLPENCGYKVKPYSWRLYSKSLSKICSHAGLRQAFSSQALKEAKKFTWESSSHAYANYLSQILKHEQA